MTRHLFYLILFTLLTSTKTMLGQPTHSIPTMKAVATTEEITIDGALDEAIWQSSTPAKDFWQYFPTSDIKALDQTEIYMVYDKTYLYVGVKCYSYKTDYIIPSLRRDYRAGGNDNITLLFDTFNDRTNSFVFGMNPYGVRREALISNGGNEREDFNGAWDNKWFGEAGQYDDFWVAEFAIPLKTLRYSEGSQLWGFNSYRFNTTNNETSTWANIPRNQMIMNLADMGALHFETPLPKPGTNMAVIPYLSGNSTQDFEAGETNPNYDYGVGGDAKIAVTSGLNLDLTINPDFSQVEVDRQVTNLDRFEIFFPERRQFFLENADLFSSFGNDRINPFFSRRIGIATDTATGSAIQNPILYGARLSGKLNDDLRVGLLNMQTAADEVNALPSFNYTVAALQQRIFRRSNIGAIFVNKETFTDLDTSSSYNQFNRVAGLDYNLASADNRWRGKAFYHRSITSDTDNKDAYSHGAFLNYRDRDKEFSWGHSLVGEGYDAEVGFVPRTDFFRMRPSFQFFFYPKMKAINRNSFGINYDVLFKPAYGRTDQQIEMSWDVSWANTARSRFRIQHQYTYLFDDFDPTRTDSEELPADSEYNNWSVNGFYSSDRRKKLSFWMNPNFGEYFNGTRFGLRGELTYRFQPYGFVALSYDYNRIQLPQPYASANLLLIGPRIDLTFTRSLFLTTFLQYNNQIDNFNVNARFQWRFSPVSDFFLVYTDNYYATDFAQKNRAIVAKVTYWLNL